MHGSTWLGGAAGPLSHVPVSHVPLPHPPTPARSVVKYVKSFTMEDMLHFVNTASLHIFQHDVLPPCLAELWGHLRVGGLAKLCSISMGASARAEGGGRGQGGWGRVPRARPFPPYTCAPACGAALLPLQQPGGLGGCPPAGSHPHAALR
jgi:hypothetical protein